MLLKYKFKKLVSVITVCAILLTVGDLQTYAAVNDNVVTAAVEKSIGDNVGKAFPTVFDFLQNIWLKLDNITVALNNIERKVDRQTATAGGGCYYTVYTNKPYLDGYKLKLYDGTSAKSCYIGYDPDSEYWCGVVRVPLNNNITIEIFDPDTGISQGSMDTSAVTTSGYATINLDPLLDGIYTSVLDINDSLATLMYKQTYYTQNSTWLPTIVSKLVEHDEHLPDFMQSSAGLIVESDSFATLYCNRDEFLSCINSSVGSYFLSDPTIGQHIADSRELLRYIIDDSVAVTNCEINSEFCNYLNNTALQKLTKTADGGLENKVEGNILILSVTSGSLGGSHSANEYIGATMEDYRRQPNYYIRGRCSSIHGDIILTYLDDSDIILHSGSTSGVLIYTKNGYTNDTTSNMYFAYETWYGDNATTGANVTKGVYRFAHKFIIDAFVATSIQCPTLSLRLWSGFDNANINTSVNTGTCCAGTPTANSVITYVDLDAEV